MFTFTLLESAIPNSNNWESSLFIALKKAAEAVPNWHYSKITKFWENDILPICWPNIYHSWSTRSLLRGFRRKVTHLKPSLGDPIFFSHFTVGFLNSDRNRESIGVLHSFSSLSSIHSQNMFQVLAWTKIPLSSIQSSHQTTSIELKYVTEESCWFGLTINFWSAVMTKERRTNVSLDPLHRSSCPLASGNRAPWRMMEKEGTQVREEPRHLHF